LVLTNSDGVKTSAYSVFWTIKDSHGRIVSQRQQASYGDLSGEYFAAWTVNVITGNYIIYWEWMDEIDSPLSMKSMDFNVYCAPAILYENNDCCLISEVASCDAEITSFSGSLMATYRYNCSTVSASCGGGVGMSHPFIYTGGCDSVEVSQVIHLSEQVLPFGGSYTNQLAYHIPSGIREMVFYVTYRRGAPGGFPLLRLMLGNGVDEVRSTMIDVNFNPLGPVSYQNLYQNDLIGPVPDSDDPITFNVQISVAGGIKTARLLVSESGMVGSPGTIYVTLTASS
jgi:hypothetical protein